MAHDYTEPAGVATMNESTSFPNDARNLAAAFVESTTEYDYDELPEQVQAKLLEAATGVIKFMNPDTITITETTIQVGSAGPTLHADVRIELTREERDYIINEPDERAS